MNAIVVRINGKAIKARVGDTLVEAGIGGGIVLPHDCLTGQCDTCRVCVVSGEIDAQGTQERDTVLGCKAKALSDVDITYEEIPGVAKWTGEVVSLTPMAGDIYEVIIGLKQRIPYLAGQYVYAAFAALPERAYSPTIGLDAYADELRIVFHIRVYPGGEVSPHLGGRIALGTRVAIRGPFGHAYLRRGDNRIVFVCGGAGFAPIWSMALASRLSQPGREIVVVTGASTIERLYMTPALQWLLKNGAEKIVVTASDGDGGEVKQGWPSDHMPELRASDTVHVAGSPALVRAVVEKARAAGANYYTDPFTPAVSKVPGFGARVAGFFGRGKAA